MSWRLDNRKGMAVPFAIPMVWREPSNHSNDCCFYLTPPVASDMNRKKKKRIEYPGTKVYQRVSRLVP